MKRNFGLDIYRSIAILMVLACHSLAFFYSSQFNVVPLVYVLGLGVEIFFALSGFLIGGILIRDVVERPQSVSAPRALFSFYIRRWLRTLPLYYLMVMVSLYYPQWPHFSLRLASLNKSELLANLLFIQNFQQNWLDLQPVSWSLSIEEWFYLLIPVGMLAISLVRQRSLRPWLVLVYGITVILIALTYRTSDFLINHNSWDYGTRKQIFMHMDALMFGVLAAWLRHYFAGRYARVAHSRWIGALAAILVVFMSYRYVYLLFLNGTVDGSLIAHTLSLSIMGVGFAVLVMVFQAQFTNISLVPAWIISMIEHISTRSYGYYLIHWPIFVLMQRNLAPTSPLAQDVLVNILALTLTFVIAGVVHLFYEQPLMRLRGRMPFISSTPAKHAKVALNPALSASDLQESASLPVTQPLRRMR